MATKKLTTLWRFLPVNEYRFLCYVGNRAVDDGHLERVSHPKEGLDVVLTDPAGRTVVVQFRGVKSVTEKHPEGMAVYGVGETTATPPWRRFVFVNWGGDDSALEVVAETLSVKVRHPERIPMETCA